MPANRLPTKEEINPIPDDLDGQMAVEDFLGKSLDETEVMFRENTGHCWESLNYLGPVAFRFYVQAAIKCLHDELLTTYSPRISWFADVIGLWLDYQPNELKPVAGVLSHLCEEYLEQYLRFDEEDAMASETLSRLRNLPQVSEAFLKMSEERLERRPGLRARLAKIQERLSQLCDDTL